MKETEQIAKKQSLQELRILLEKKKTELQQKNRELEIEAALEKVRSQMLEMQKSSDLEKTTSIMYQQLDTLGVISDDFAVFISIIDQNSNTSHQWIVTDKSLHIPPGEKRTPLTEHPLLIKTYEGWKRKEKLLVRDIKGEELNDFLDYIYSLPSFKKDKPDPEAIPDRLIWSEAVFSEGTLGFIHSVPIPESSIKILIRFTKVLALTYKRFLDIRKAEEHAREAQIEAALERIRARSMAMHYSNELKDVVRLLYKEFRPLITDFATVNIQLNMDTTRDLYFWAGVNEDIYQQLYHLPASDLPHFDKVDEAWKSEDGFLNIIFNREEKDAFFNEVYEIQNVPQKRRKMIQGIEGMNLMGWFQKYSGIDLLRYDLKPFNAEEIQIVKRFSEVFEQTYIRFLDLQKAEAQAHEAQIEASLERVRASAMAMHQSIELHDVIKVISEQITALGIKFDHSTFIRFNNDKSIEVWVTTPEQPYPAQIHVPFLDHAFFNIQSELTKMKSDFLAEMYDKKEKDRFFRHFFKNTIARNIPVDRQNYVLQAPGMARCTFPVSSIYFSIANYDCIPYTDEEIKVLRRLAQVTEQAYTRFLDLQKAEAQAREAEIQLALERVRAASMAMHKSSEIQEVVNIVFKQLHILGFSMSASMIINIDEIDNGLSLWIATEKGNYARKMHIPYFDNPIITRGIEAIKNQKEFYADIYGEKVARSFNEKMIHLPDWKTISEERKKFLMSVPGYARSVALCKHTGIALTNYEPKPYSEEENGILKRFSKVFEQSFTRFLDLQKAEAQAREAQIEAALEKVRATAMAMHESNELNKVIREVSEQLTLLGFDFDISNIGTNISPEGFYIWNASPAESIISGVYVPYKNLDFIKWFYSNREKDTPVSIRFTKAQKNAFFRHYFTKTEGKNLSPERKKYVLDGQSLNISTVHKREFTLNIHNYRGIIYSDEQNHILYRFANVFEQAYTRFLDLQKAETQAREAQVEAALERVRAKAMAMHKSEELQEVVHHIFEEIAELGVDMSTAVVTSEFNEEHP
ncbi:MAG TPA: hypothetical protein VKA38_04995, partial [Draconibacterium sp.]|nr:hypothetical protein [Draconibacterium sp.]